MYLYILTTTAFMNLGKASLYQKLFIIYAHKMTIRKNNPLFVQVYHQYIHGLNLSPSIYKTSSY